MLCAGRTAVPCRVGLAKVTECRRRLVLLMVLVVLLRLWIGREDQPIEYVWEAGRPGLAERACKRSFTLLVLMLLLVVMATVQVKPKRRKRLWRRLGLEFGSD